MFLSIVDVFKFVLKELDETINGGHGESPKAKLSGLFQPIAKTSDVVVGSSNLRELFLDRGSFGV